MAIVFNDNFEISTGKPIDNKYFSSIGQPYTSITDVNNTILVTFRYEGLTVNINNVEYWYKDGISDTDLIVKEASSSLEQLTDVELSGLTNNEHLIYNSTSGKWENKEFINTDNFIDLTDVDDSDYIGKKGYVPLVNSAEDGLELINPYETTRQGTYWMFNSGNTSGDPGNDNISVDNMVISSISKLFISHVMDNINVVTILDKLIEDDTIILIQEDDHEKYMVLSIDGTPINQGNYTEIDVILNDYNTLFDHNSVLLTNLFFDEQGGGGGGGHVIKENGTSTIQQPNLNFITANSETVITNVSATTTTQIALTVDSMNDVDTTGRQNSDIVSYNTTTENHEYVSVIPFDEILRSPDANINTNGLISTYVPKGYKIDTIIITEDTSNAAGNISISTTSGYTGDIVDSLTVSSDGVYDAPLGQQFFSLTNDQNIYVNSSTWGSGKITIYFTFKKVI